MKRLVAVASLAGLILAFGMFSTAQNQVRLQLGLLVDGSGSISATDFELVRSALIASLSDSNLIPHTGVVEITIVQFSDERARVEVAPTVLTADSVDDITSKLRSMTQGRGGTPLWLGIDAVTNAMVGSANFNIAERQTINIATDGQPQVPVSNIAVAQGITLSNQARDRAVSNGIDEIDAEGVGQAITDTGFRNFLLQLVWPQPGTLVDGVNNGSTFDPGFVTLVANFQDFEEALRAKVAAIVSSGGLNGNGDGDGTDRPGGGTAPGPGGRPIPFDTPMGTALLAGVLGTMMLVFRFKEHLRLGARK
ncbi:MAG TPA: vWA domain-containing protein [Candidatus Bipolaricaulota bacterium]